jgi:hypothetical protein
MDARPLSELVAFVEAARAAGDWLVLVGHTVVDERTDAYAIERTVLESFLDYLSASRTRVWVDTVGAVGRHVRRLQAQRLEL